MSDGNSSAVEVSVIVPAYNAARTLRATLESARAQTNRRIEIIVVDDGSTDATSAIAADMAAVDNRIHLVRQANAGVSAARNAGIAAACAPYLAFLDADDLWPPQHLDVHLAAFADDTDLDLSFSAARYIDEGCAVVGGSRPSHARLTAAALAVSNPTATTSTWVVRRAAFERTGLFDMALKRSEDHAWLVRAALTGIHMRGCDRATIDYRISSTGLASDLDGMRRGFIAMLDRLSFEHPAFVALNRARAMAAEDLYLARRALQLSLPSAIARHHLALAFRAAPLHLLAKPRASGGVVLRLLTRKRRPEFS